MSAHGITSSTAGAAPQRKRRSFEFNAPVGVAAHANHVNALDDVPSCKSLPEGPALTASVCASETLEQMRITMRDGVRTLQPAPPGIHEATTYLSGHNNRLSFDTRGDDSHAHLSWHSSCLSFDPPHRAGGGSGDSAHARAQFAARASGSFSTQSSEDSNGGDGAAQGNDGTDAAAQLRVQQQQWRSFAAPQQRLSPSWPQLADIPEMHAVGAAQQAAVRRVSSTGGFANGLASASGGAAATAPAAGIAGGAADASPFEIVSPDAAKSANQWDSQADAALRASALFATAKLPQHLPQHRAGSTSVSAPAVCAPPSHEVSSASKGAFASGDAESAPPVAEVEVGTPVRDNSLTEVLEWQV